MENIKIDLFEISAARKELAITQKEAANLVKVSERTWQQWERGQRKMRPSYWELFLIKTDYKPKMRNKNIFDKYDQKDIRFNQNELAKITHLSEQRLNRNKKYKFIDLFAGIGGIRTAFQSVGAGCVFSSEIDPFAQYTYYTNFGVVPHGDICKINEGDVPEHDILCGGFPCQPFSHIGKREGFDHPTQGTMFDEILKIIDSNTPRVVFLENVPGILNHDNGNTIKTILNELSDRGYNYFHTILNSSDFGVPQNRKRFYLVCFKDKNIKFKFPEPPMQKVDIGDYLETNVSGYTISKHLQKSYLYKKDDGRPNVIDKTTKGSIKTLVSTYHKIQRLTGTFVKDGETGLRLLTSNECKSVMGFSQDFEIPVSRTQMYRQMGNSVVIKVVTAIAEEIVHSLKEHDKKQK